jgi:hypothetical protein
VLKKNNNSRVPRKPMQKDDIIDRNVKKWLQAMHAKA